MGDTKKAGNKTRKQLRIHDPAGTGEIVRIPLEGSLDQNAGVLLFLALLAYPYKEQKSIREDFIESLDAMLHKAPYGHDAKIRELVPKKYRMRSNRAYEDTVNKGARKITTRLAMGSVAIGYLYAGMRFRYATDKQFEQIGESYGLVPAGNVWRRPMSVTLLEKIGNRKSPSVGVELRAPESFTAAMRAAVKARARAEKISYAAGPYGDEGAYAQEDEKRNHWLPSMPVLHLAVAFHEELFKLPEPLRFEHIVWDLFQYPQWLVPALVRAEGYRSILTDRLPDGCGFDPSKALRLIQK